MDMNMNMNMTEIVEPSAQTIEDLEPGSAVSLDAEATKLVIEAIREYDPEMAAIQSVVRSVGTYLLDVTLADGAVWKMYQHPARLMCTLGKLGARMIDKTLTADLACVYCPTDIDRGIGRTGHPVKIPAVDCGAGYRQLEFNEEILTMDEWYGGPRQGWAKTNEAGRHYAPTHSNASYGPFAPMRRKLPV